MRPTLRCLLVFVAGIPVALGAVAIHPRLWAVWLAYLGAAVLLAGFDALLALPRRHLQVAARMPAQLFIGETGAATVELSARRRAAGRDSIELLAELDDALAPQPPGRVVLRAAGPREPVRGELAIPLVPRRRGDHALRAVHAR